MFLDTQHVEIGKKNCFGWNLVLAKFLVRIWSLLLINVTMKLNTSLSFLSKFSQKKYTPKTSLKLRNFMPCFLSKAKVTLNTVWAFGQMYFPVHYQKLMITITNTVVIYGKNNHFELILTPFGFNFLEIFCPNLQQSIGINPHGKLRKMHVF